MDSTLFSIIALVSSILLLIVLILRFKIHAFISLLTVSIYLGIITGMPISSIVNVLETGIGGILGFLAGVIGLGTILGKMLDYSGGAEVLATTLLRKMGEKRAALVMSLVGVIAGISVFVEVGFVLLYPIVYFVAKKARVSLLYLGIPMAVSLMIVHCMVPPHPAAFAITVSLGADVGKVIMYSLLIGTPTAIIAGPLWAKLITPRCENLLVKEDAVAEVNKAENVPSFAMTLLIVTLPLLLMVGKTILLMFIAPETTLGDWIGLIGNPLIALFISVILAYIQLGIRKNRTWADLLKVTDECVKPIAGILLIIGAGGAFNEMLLASGLGNSLSLWLSSVHMSPILLAWFVAWILHGAIGSATVAMLGAAGMVAPLMVLNPNISPEIIVLAIGSGAIGWCHVNDSLFWLVKELLGVSLQDMFKSFTTACLLASFISLGGIYLLSLFI